MAEKRKKAPLMQTPRGVFKYPKITKVDTGTKDYPKPDGEWNIRVVYPADRADVKAFIEKLTVAHEAAVEQAEREFKDLKLESRKKLQKANGETGIKVNDLFTELYDKDTEEPTGEIEFKFKMKASGTRKDGSKWKAKPGVFDARMKPLPKGVDVWGGSEGIISFRAEPYFIPGTGAAGLGLKLEAVQVLELVSGGNRSGESYGFSAQDGFDASTVEPEEEDDENTSDDAGEASDSDDGNF